MPNALLQLFLVSWTSIRTIPRRRAASLAAMAGIAGVVAVMVAVLSIGEGFKQTLATTGDTQTAIVMRGGTDTEMNSAITLDHTRIIADAPGVLRDEEGPIASAEIFVLIDLPKTSTGTAANVPLRGVEPAVFKVRPRVSIVAGRSFEPGRNELIAGIGAVETYDGLELGSTLRTGNSEWTVVGHFSAAGTVPESELWCDARVLGPAYMRGSVYQSVYARLESAGAFTTFKDALTTDPRLNVMVERETDYYAEQSLTLTTLVRVLGVLVAVLMGAGALFGAFNTMYSAVAARTREIATLRALGFRSLPVIVSVIAESLLLALFGGAVGAVAAYTLFHGFRAATLNWDTFSMVTFAFAVTPALMVKGILYSLVLGLIGGLPPAIRAARLPVATALRQL
jgi:putative ABC transport system permease protein